MKVCLIFRIDISTFSSIKYYSYDDDDDISILAKLCNFYIIKMLYLHTVHDYLLYI